MFGLFKRAMAPGGPATFDFDVEIDRPAEEVYALLDFGDARCAKRQVGTVEQTAPDQFLMRLDLLPGHDIDVHVIAAEPHSLFSFDSVITPQPGKLVACLERYEIESAGPEACIVRLIVEATFEPGMGKKAWAQEVARMALGCDNALVKLKLHAECGVEVIREVERLQVA